MTPFQLVFVVNLERVQKTNLHATLEMCRAARVVMRIQLYAIDALERQLRNPVRTGIKTRLA